MRLSLDRLVEEQAPALRHERRHARGRSGGSAADETSLPRDADRAAPVLDEAHDRAQDRGLAGAVRAEQGDRLTLGDLQAHVADDVVAPVTGVEVRDLEASGREVVIGRGTPAGPAGRSRTISARARSRPPRRRRAPSPGRKARTRSAAGARSAHADPCGSSARRGSSPRARPRVGDRPASGSSRISVCGPATQAAASCVSCSMPWGTSAMRAPAQRPAPTSESASVTARPHPPAVSRRVGGSAGQNGARATSRGIRVYSPTRRSAARTAPDERRRLERPREAVPRAGWRRRPAPRCTPWIAIVPDCGCSRPADEVRPGCSCRTRSGRSDRGSCPCATLKIDVAQHGRAAPRSANTMPRHVDRVLGLRRLSHRRAAVTTSGCRARLDGRRRDVECRPVRRSASRRRQAPGRARRSQDCRRTPPRPGRRTPRGRRR